MEKLTSHAAATVFSAVYLLPSTYFFPVHLDRLTLHHFRNLHGLEVRPAPGLNLVVGPNGHGKSNLLESIHFLALAHSARTRKDKDLIAWDAPPDAGFVVRGEATVGTRAHTQSLEYREGGSRVRVEGLESRRLGDLLGHLLLVAFTPEDLDLLRGGPGERRRFLDVLLCQLDPPALDVLRRYRMALRQRNAALRWNLRGEEEALLDAYEATLAEAGAGIVFRRREWVEKLAPKAAEFYREIVGESGAGAEALTLSLSLGVSGKPEIPETPYLLAEMLAARLRESRARDRENGVTSVGPHRDDLLTFLDEKTVRDFASQGQKRSVALALKLASARLLEETSGLPPILILDDVFAELDPGRRERFGALIAGGGQAFIATPRREDLPFDVEAVVMLEKGKRTGGAQDGATRVEQESAG
jgi:DNA replication and repair protein RecF